MKKILVFGLICFGLIGCCGGEYEKNGYDYVGDTITVNVIGTNFECTGKLFDDHMGYKSHGVGIKCSDGTVLHNLTNFIVK